ncbi:cyclophilin-like domain-containing protein [Russula compacta]|nr:cyclophilin-like domain-containing protein [Russula compacta]
MALPTHGRVLLDTTAGDIDIELWSKEAPKACRNFIALAMEGYYDGVVFHRVVPDFLVQTGDRTGTGAGGESFFGEQFEDEIHPRLRFAHRGLVAMANGGAKNTNDSQFFITLDRADELHGKHTLFGRCVGDTIYSASFITSSSNLYQLDDNGRPLYPPKIKSVRIIDNPLTTSDTKLLSFGADADEERDDVPVAPKKKSVARPDLVENPDQPSISISDALFSKQETVARGEAKRESDAPTVKSKSEDLSKIREAHQREKAASSSARQTEIERMEAEVKRLARQRDGGDSEEERTTKKIRNKSQLEEELAKYEKSRGVHRKGRKKDESDEQLQTSVATRDEDEAMGVSSSGDAEAGPQAIEEGDAGMEVDSDRGFMGHLLQFPKGNEEEVQKAERDYEVIDPRARSAQARQEERDRKAKAAATRKRGRH